MTTGLFRACEPRAPHRLAHCERPQPRRSKRLQRPLKLSHRRAHRRNNHGFSHASNSASRSARPEHLTARAAPAASTTKPANRWSVSGSEKIRPGGKNTSTSHQTRCRRLLGEPSGLSRYLWFCISARRLVSRVQFFFPHLQIIPLQPRTMGLVRMSHGNL